MYGQIASDVTNTHGEKSSIYLPFWFKSKIEGTMTKKQKNGKVILADSLKTKENWSTIFLQIPASHVKKIELEYVWWIQLNCAQLKFRKIACQYQISLFYTPKITNQKVFFVLGDPVKNIAFMNFMKKCVIVNVYDFNTVRT